MNAIPQPEWMATVQVGDVLTDGRVYRVVREVSHWRPRYSPNELRLRGVAFTIRHCSWTRRCHTTLTAADLKQRHFRPAGIRVKLNKSIDAAIAEELADDRRRRLRCCDVRGVA